MYIIKDKHGGEFSLVKRSSWSHYISFSSLILLLGTVSIIKMYQPNSFESGLLVFGASSSWKLMCAMLSRLCQLLSCVRCIFHHFLSFLCSYRLQTLIRLLLKTKLCLLSQSKVITNLQMDHWVWGLVLLFWKVHLYFDSMSLNMIKYYHIKSNSLLWEIKNFSDWHLANVQLTTCSDQFIA